MLEPCETMANRHAKSAEAAGTTHIMRFWLTMQPARKKYSASSTCIQICTQLASVLEYCRHVPE